MLSQKQLQLASILPRIPAAMSWLGSLSIVVDVFRKSRRGRNSNSTNTKPTTYHRLMLGMSLYDMSFSGALMMTTWPIPVNTPGAYDPRGNDASCATQAFFMQLGIGAPFYNLCLAAYYYSFIVRNRKPSVFAERCMHLSCASFAFGTAAAGLAMDFFGFAGFWCWITAENNLFRYLFFHGPIWIIIVAISIIMLVIYYDLMKQEKRQRRWKVNTPAADREGGGDDAAPDEERLTTETRYSTVTERLKKSMKSRRENKRQSGCRVSASVKSQAYWYVGSFFSTWIFLTIARAMETAGVSAIPFWLTILGVTLVPFQGFFNFWIYIRPRYRMHREKYPGTGRMATFFRVSPLFAGCNCCDGAGGRIMQTMRGCFGRGVAADANENSDAGTGVGAWRPPPMDYNSQEDEEDADEENDKASHLRDDEESEDATALLYVAPCCASNAAAPY